MSTINFSIDRTKHKIVSTVNDIAPDINGNVFIQTEGGSGGQVNTIGSGVGIYVDTTAPDGAVNPVVNVAYDPNTIGIVDNKIKYIGPIGGQVDTVSANAPLSTVLGTAANPRISFNYDPLTLEVEGGALKVKDLPPATYGKQVDITDQNRLNYELQNLEKFIIGDVFFNFSGTYSGQDVIVELPSCTGCGRLVFNFATTDYRDQVLDITNIYSHCAVPIVLTNGIFYSYHIEDCPNIRFNGMYTYSGTFDGSSGKRPIELSNTTLYVQGGSFALTTLNPTTFFPVLLQNGSSFYYDNDRVDWFMAGAQGVYAKTDGRRNRMFLPDSMKTQWSDATSWSQELPKLDYVQLGDAWGLPNITQ